MSDSVYKQIPGVRYRFVSDYDRGEVRWELLDESDKVTETRILRTAELIALPEVLVILAEVQANMYERRRFDKVTLKRPGG